MKLMNPKKPVMASWLHELGHRLDAPPFLSGAIEARKTLADLHVRKDRLASLTLGGLSGIIHAGRIPRIWVEDRDYGVPFLSSTDILQADLATLRFISNRAVTANPKLIIRSGWTLITRSGTIGRTAYARAEMDQMACTEDVLRIAPDLSKIPSGYLYAFLSSRFGVPIVASGTYGAIIQHIEPEHIADLPVPRFSSRLEKQVHELIESANAMRTEASELIQKSVDELHLSLGIERPKPWREYGSPLCSSTSSHELTGRLDAFYYCEQNRDARTAFDSGIGQRRIAEVAEGFIPGIFKRLYADDQSFGVPYLTGADIFTITPSSNRHLLRTVAEQYGLTLREGMIVIQEAGQLSGIVGRSVLVGTYLDGFACSNNMVRLIPNNPEDTGYLYATLHSGHGVRLVKREAAGSSIPHIERNRIAELEIPWPDRPVRKNIGMHVIRATGLRDEANELEGKARLIVETAIEENA